MRRYFPILLAVSVALLALFNGCGEKPTEPSLVLQPPVLPMVPVDTLTTGTWTKANSPYRITGVALLPPGETLTIEPGVDVIFENTFAKGNDWKCDYLTPDNVGPEHC